MDPNQDAPNGDANTAPDNDRSDLVTAKHDHKRIIVSCDGTWLNSTASPTSTLQQDSNATRITRAIRSRSASGVKQIVYYSQGVGSRGITLDRIYNGITGEGLEAMVREAYAFICTNYEEGDEIFLFGFSRGAFTARTIANIIDKIGVLTRTGLPYLPEIYRDVRHRRNKNYQPREPNKPFRNKPSAGDPRYSTELQRRGYTTLGVLIKAVCVWETVGALGTPRIGWLDKIGLQSSVSKELSFDDTRVSDCVENAFQALALDERRASFRPALWEKDSKNKTNLRQVWFPGVHSNVGGGYDDQSMANITLAWMLSQVRDLLDFDPDYVLDEQARTEALYSRQAADSGGSKRARPWSFGKIYNSLSGIYILGGSTVRTPGRYFSVEPTTGKASTRPLQRTYEYVHPCVRTRVKLRGPGPEDKGEYTASALTKEWRIVVDPPERDDGRPDIIWELKEQVDAVSTDELPEVPLRPLERELLAMGPDRNMEAYVLRPDLQRTDTKRAKRKSVGRTQSQSKPRP